MKNIIIVLALLLVALPVSAQIRNPNFNSLRDYANLPVIKHPKVLTEEGKTVSGKVNRCLWNRDIGAKHVDCHPSNEQFGLLLRLLTGK